MASYRNALEHTNTPFQSPAKIFAKLKSKVQKESTKEWSVAGNDPACGVREEDGADFTSLWRRKESFWDIDEFKDNHRGASYQNKAEALTLSPISSPQKSLGYPYSDLSRRAVVELPHANNTRDAPASSHRYTPSKRHLMESTAVFQPLVNTKQTHRPSIADVDGYTVTTRTPVKKHYAENSCLKRRLDDGCAPLETSMNPASIFSPMRNRLKKRKLEEQGINKVSSSTNDVTFQQKERKTSTTFTEDDTCSINTEDFRRRGYSCHADRYDTNPFTHEPKFAEPRSTALKRCQVEVVQLMSPAKMFAYMKERENRRELQEVHQVSSNIRELLDEGRNRRSSDAPLSTFDNTEGMEDNAFRSEPESVSPVTQDGVELADSQSDSDPPEEFLPSAMRPQPVLLEDPLVLNSPHISIPKKHKAVFKHNQWPLRTTFPSESTIYLDRWYLRRNRTGLFVDGFRKEENIPWNSNIVVERVSHSVVKTVSGRVYVLVGKMKLNVYSEFPRWLLKKFANGFPSNWKELYEKFLSELRDSCPRESEKNSEGRSIMAKTTSEASTLTTKMKRHRKNPLKTPDSCPPVFASSTKVSRSGRLIKPPLEYWKGGRVILDAHMNVTVFEGYDTSICNPNVTTKVSSRASQKPAQVLLPRSRGRKQCVSTSDIEPPVPLRKVKTSDRKRTRAKVNPEQRLPKSPEPPVVTSHSSSAEERCYTKRLPASGRRQYVDTQPQSEPEKRSTRRSNRNTHDTSRPPVRVSGRKRIVAPLAESSTDNDTLQRQSSDEEFSVKKKKQSERLRRKRAVRSSRSSQSTGESGRELTGRTRVTKKSNEAKTQARLKPNKCSKTSPPTMPLPKLTQSSKKHKVNTVSQQDQEEHEWTETELINLQQAVSSYPKHIAGYWAKVAKMVGTRSAEECHVQHACRGNAQTPAKKSIKTKKEKVKAPKASDNAVISARAGTLRRKQQVRQFLETMPREDVDDVFSSAYMQNKRFEIPSMCQSEDQDFSLTDLEPLTPRSTGFPEVKTPQCLHITPGMMGSPNRNNDDRYVYQLQKRMKKSQFNVYKEAPSKSVITPPSVKRTMRRCGNTENDTFVVWEMFPEKAGALAESGEEEDFYFSDSD